VLTGTPNLTAFTTDTSNPRVYQFRHLGQRRALKWVAVDLERELSRFVRWKIEEELRSKAARGWGSASSSAHAVSRASGMFGAPSAASVVEGLPRILRVVGRRGCRCVRSLDIAKHKASIHVGF
jgi:hypothetical protein